MASKDWLHFLWNLGEYGKTVNLIDSFLCFYVGKAHEVAVVGEVLILPSDCCFCSITVCTSCVFKHH